MNNIPLKYRNILQRTPLHCAVCNDRFSICLILVAYGADESKKDRGPSAIEFARNTKCKRICQMLENATDSMRRHIKSQRLFDMSSILEYRKRQWYTFLLGSRDGSVAELNGDVLELILKYFSDSDLIFRF
eukprot:c8560_g1_i5.p1 GENE.c8560_g1_i5~~c8560_g1_i5.p1  ORF type:complete len:131 (+),score=21.81 c8560_g1_i5:297-689(+)